MTIDINGTDIGQVIELAIWVASLIAMLVVGLLVYLMVRPPKHVREARRKGPKPRREREISPAEGEDLWRLVDRMEARLEVLERALADQSGNDRQRILQPAEERREDGGEQ
jgi:hypothetical protein